MWREMGIGGVSAVFDGRLIAAVCIDSRGMGLF